MLIDPTDPRPLWLLVRTKPKQERTVISSLDARGVVGYCPRVLEPRLHVRAPRGPVPLFPSYVFARFVLEHAFAAVNYCPGVLGVVRFGGHFAAIEEAIVDSLREREGERGFLEIRAVRQAPRLGSRARIMMSA